MFFVLVVSFLFPSILSIFFQLVTWNLSSCSSTREAQGRIVFVVLDDGQAQGLQKTLQSLPESAEVVIASYTGKSCYRKALEVVVEKYKDEEILAFCLIKSASILGKSAESAIRKALGKGIQAVQIRKKVLENSFYTFIDALNTTYLHHLQKALQIIFATGFLTTDGIVIRADVMKNLCIPYRFSLIYHLLLKEGKKLGYTDETAVFSPVERVKKSFVLELQECWGFFRDILRGNTMMIVALFLSLCFPPWWVIGIFFLLPINKVTFFLFFLLFVHLSLCIKETKLQYKKLFSKFDSFTWVKI